MQLNLHFTHTLPMTRASAQPSLALGLIFQVTTRRALQQSACEDVQHLRVQLTAIHPTLWGKSDLQSIIRWPQIT